MVTLSIAAIFRNEAPYLKEWIEYHRLVGVDHFYLYNNESSDAFLEELSPYLKEGTVSLIDWPDAKPPKDNPKAVYSWIYHTQVTAYEDACCRSADKTTWLALIDIDEFMVPVLATDMKELLEKYKEAPGIMLHWQLYGTSGVDSLPPRTLLIEALCRTAGPHDLYNSRAVKSIIKPKLYRGFRIMAHECLFSNGQQGVHLEKNEARLNHYMNRTTDYFLHHKIEKKEHMEGDTFSESELREMQKRGNECEDQERPIARFILPLRSRMGYE
jgi:hypothetical protein